MSEDDFDDDGLACPPRPLRARAKRVKIHQHSQYTVVEFDGPHGPIHIESSTTITVEAIEDDVPPSVRRRLRPAVAETVAGSKETVRRRQTAPCALRTIVR